MSRRPSQGTTPALLLLLKAPRAGAVKTRLAADLGASLAVRINRQLVERQIRALPAGWPVSIHFAPPRCEAMMRAWLEPLRPGLRFVPQCAGNLGARLAAALAAEFSRRPAGVIAIGGDCPYLTRTILLRAARALGTTDVVLGPATDGGYYLIASHGSHPELFRGISWSTAQVLAQTLARARSARLRVRRIETLEDVDDGPGWQRAVAAGAVPGQG